MFLFFPVLQYWGWLNVQRMFIGNVYYRWNLSLKPSAQFTIAFSKTKLTFLCSTIKGVDKMLNKREICVWDEISSFDYHGEKASKYFDPNGSNNDKTTFNFGGTGQLTDIKTWFWNVNELFWFNYFLLQTRNGILMYTKLHCWMLVSGEC